MKRNSNWRSQLIEYIDRARQHPFEYGEQDCALFVAQAIEVMTGVDLFSDLKGEYASLEEGIEKLKVSGFTDHIDMVSKIFDEHRNKANTQMGDIAIIDTPQGQALGIVGGAEIFVMREKGLGTMPLMSATRTFKVG